MGAQWGGEHVRQREREGVASQLWEVVLCRARGRARSLSLSLCLEASAVGIERVVRAIYPSLSEKRERERERERERDYQERYFIMRTVSIVPPPVLKGVQQKLGVSSWFPFPFPFLSPFIFIFFILEYSVRTPALRLKARS